MIVHDTAHQTVRWLVWIVVVVCVPFCPILAEGQAEQPYADPPMPAYRVDPEGFGDAAKADIEALLNSAGRELWKWFPDYEIEPFVVKRGKIGPIVLYKRNDRGEIVMRLDTEGLLWSQYSYQFAHEFCHILCGFDAKAQHNKWFEETLCEMASLYAMRAMAKAWEDDPPYNNWRGYRKSLKQYSDNVIASREKLEPEDVATYYRKHLDALKKNPGMREINGAMAIVLLDLFEKSPENWEAVRWLNAAEDGRNGEFADYLQAWHDESPKRHRAFIAEIAGLFDIKLKPNR